MPIVTTSSRKRKSSKIPLVITTLVVILLGVGYILFSLNGKDNEPIAEPVAQEPVKASLIITNTVNNVSAVEPASEPVKSAPLRSPLIIRPSQKGETRSLSLAKTGTVVRAVALGAGITATNVLWRGKAAFHNPTENFIYKYANSVKNPCMIMTRFKSDAEEEVRKILETDIIIYEDDDEDTVAIKESVAGLKQDLLKAIEEGYNAADVLNEMREDNNNRVRNRFKMQRELNSLIKSNMVDQAVEYFNAANKKLNDDFLPPLVFSEDKLPKQ